MKTMKKTFVFAFLCLFLLTGRSVLAAPVSQAPTSTQAAAVVAAAEWLVTTHQNDDGGYTAFSTGAGAAPSDLTGTLDAMIALSSAGYPVAVPFPDYDAAPLDFVKSDPEALVDYANGGGGSAGRVLLALAGAGQNPRAFLGSDFVDLTLAQLDEEGRFGATAFEHSLALLGLAAADEPAPGAALVWLLSQQASDGDLAGSWDDGFGTPGNADATALAMMALIAHDLPLDDPALVAARDFLAVTQQPAGWEYGAGFGANANSTGLVIGALSALGEDFYSDDSPWFVDGVSPLAALLAWQAPEGGFTVDFGDGPFPDFYATVQSLPFATGWPLPLTNRMAAAANAASCLTTLADPAGGWASFAGGTPDAGGTARAVQALQAVAANERAPEWGEPLDPAVLATLAAQTPDYLVDARGGRAGAVVLAVVAAGADPNDFGGVDLIQFIQDSRNDAGEYDDTSFGPFAHSRALLALVVAGAQPADSAVNWLIEAGSAGDWGSADSTGLALNVLSRLGIPGQEAVLALWSSQLPAGGWGFDDSANPSATAEAVQGLVAAGYNPYSPNWQQSVDGRLVEPSDVVLATQMADGCWPNLFGEGADPYSTVDAILLLTQFAPSWDVSEGVQPPVAEEEVETTDTEVEPVATEAPMIEGEPTAEPEPVVEEIDPDESTEVPAAEPEVEEAADDETEAVDETRAEADADNSADDEAAANVDENSEPEAGGLSGWLVAVAALIGAGGAFIWWRRRG